MEGTRQRRWSGIPSRSVGVPVGRPGRRCVGAVTIRVSSSRGPGGRRASERLAPRLLSTGARTRTSLVTGVQVPGCDGGGAGVVAAGTREEVVLRASAR
jgi:hypothetical protein